ncbi:hypothetical protein [Jiangella asiatica]|uniref:Uncharacterized protein n=1 Tax=Jiangella asiatica TaxID=2530372 RepID=A0A4R5CWB8_9ACTN|nr:hypothetical protein [Jiangella asiatica]TDE02834.1 hypothetical protein E1269_21320 [Jiangella asiatica]
MADIPATPADGNVSVIVVDTIADPTAPTVTELTDPTVVDISCYLTSDGYTPSLDEQVIADERLCSTQIFEQPGRFTRSLDTIYIDNTNAPNEATDNAAKDTLVPGSTHFLVTRRGIKFDTAYAADQKVVVTPIKCGQYNELTPEANSVLKTAQKQFITGPTVEGTVVAAP